MDDPAHTRDRTTTAGTGLQELPPYLVTGNRFGSYGFGAGLTALLLSLVSFGHVVAWPLALAAIALGFTGFARYAQDGATNRDTSLVGLAMGWVALFILLVDAWTTLSVPPEYWTYVGT